MPCRTATCAYGITVRCGSALGHGVPPVHASRYSVPSEPRALSAIRAEVLSENAPVGLARDAAAHRWQQVRCNPLSTLRLTAARVDPSAARLFACTIGVGRSADMMEPVTCKTRLRAFVCRDMWRMAVRMQWHRRFHASGSCRPKCARLSPRATARGLSRNTLSPPPKQARARKRSRPGRTWTHPQGSARSLPGGSPSARREFSSTPFPRRPGARSQWSGAAAQRSAVQCSAVRRRVRV